MARKKTATQLTQEIAAALETARAREISARRIAALIANGEDVRNTIAWRDAMSERRMINLRAPPSRSDPDRAAHTRVDLRWYAIPNGNKAAGGYLPIVEEDGKVRGDTWRERGYTKAEAETRAEAEAYQHAERFVGDWNVTVRKGRNVTVRKGRFQP